MAWGIGGSWDRGVALLEETRDRARSEGFDQALEQALLGLVLVNEGFEHGPDKAEQYLTEALEYALDNELEDLRAFALTFRAGSHIWRGEWDRAEDDAREALAIWTDQHNMTLHCEQIIVHSMLRRGSPQVAESLERLLTKAKQAAPGDWWDSACVLSEAYWLDDSLPFDREWVIGVYFQHAYESWFHGMLGGWLLKKGLIEDVSSQFAEPYRLQAQGDWEGAASFWNDLGAPYEEAVALHDGPVEAKLRALSILDDLGAVPLATRIRKELREAGVKGVPAGPQRSTRDHIAGLTPRQAEVLGLIAEGLSDHEIADRLFIASRTAEHHVSAILSRLNASTRDDAVALASDLGVFSPV